MMGCFARARRTPALLLALAAGGLLLVGSVRATHAAENRLDFSGYPPPPWYSSGPSDDIFTKNGVLHVDGERVQLRDVDGRAQWSRVSNERGWWVEAKVRVNSGNGSGCLSDVWIELMDGTESFFFVLGSTSVCVVTTPATVSKPMATTDRFHTYRIEVQYRQLRVFVDGKKLIEHTLESPGHVTSRGLSFGGGRSQWDHFAYDTSPAALQGTPAIAPASRPELWRSECDPYIGQAVTFLWKPAASGTQWLDISTMREGFAPGTFMSSGPLDATAWAFRWSGLAPGPAYFARIRTATPAGIVASAVTEVPGFDCSNGAIITSVSRACLRDGTFYDMPTWQPLRVGEQWVDVSLVDNGFQPGTFVSVGPLGPDESRALIPALAGIDVAHFVRVNTVTSGGWKPSATYGYYFGRNC